MNDCIALQIGFKEDNHALHATLYSNKIEDILSLSDVVYAWQGLVLG